MLRWSLTSQYSQTLGAVRLPVLGKPCYITFMIFYIVDHNPTAQIRSGDMMAILLLPANVAIKAIDFIISFILLDSRISGGGCPRGVMVKAMACGIVVHEFVLQSRYYNSLSGK